ncbi:MAG TPA: carboxypeptidase regulatory-like domain-containing protein [Bryobacteraceae bacterium]|nr:carboxypeptidase regulatory-like domain-containing protein [Bryobacteraceae bacterium]
MRFRAIVLSLLTALVVCGQTITTADVVGVVSDTSGAVVPGATVTIKAAETNDTRTAVTNDSGQYRFPLMSPGVYLLSAHTAGLKSNSTRFTLLVGQEQAMNITLNPQGTTEVIEVTAEASVVQTENANLATSYSQKQVAELPMAGGDLTTLAMTVPGVRVAIKGGSGNMNANGVPGSSMLFTLNGADVMDPYNNLNNSGASNNLLGANEVAEAAVVLNAYSAQYGRMAGGQENIIGKSGSNTFHGNLNYSYNDALFNANSFFKNSSGTPRGRADSNLYGASVGGPVKRNRTFFFFDTEGLRYALPSSTTVSIPTPQLQQYILAHIPSIATPLYQQAFALYNAAPGLSRAQAITTGTGILQDSSGKLGCSGRGTFAGTPTGAAGQTFGVNVPCAESFVSANNSLNTESLIIARVDQTINDKQKINFRYEYDWGIQATSTSAINPAFSQISTQPQHAGQMNYTYIINPNLVNNFIGGASWYSAIFGVQDFAKAQSLMPERFVINDGGAQGGGMTTLGASFPNGRNVGQLQLIDDLSWTHGRHAVKVGMNYRYNRVTDTSIASGAYEGTYTFNDLVDLATGQINSTGKNSTFGQSFPLLFAAHIRVYSINFYGQDEWAVKPNLKLTFGMRFERDGNPSCVDNCFARMNQQFGMSGYQGGANIPYNQTITTGLNTAYAGLEAVISEPRFGFVYSPFGSGGKKPVIRGGIGLFANLFAASVAANVFNNSPNKFTPSVTFGQVGLATDPNSSLTAAIASFNGFESGFKQGFTLAQIQSALGKIKFSAPSYYSPPQNFVAPKILEWSFEIEQPLSPHNVLAATYSGNHGYDESVINADANAFTAATTLFPNGFGGLPTAAPDPRFLTVNQVLTSARSNYDALTVQVRHAFSYGFQGQIGWVWSHALGTVLGTSSVELGNPSSVNSGYGALNFDTRHMLTADFIWTSPWKFQNRILNWTAGGWNVGGKLYLYSGPPFSVTNSSLAARINSGGGIGNTFIADLLDPKAAGVYCGHSAIGTPCLTASQFATTTTQLDFGNTAPDMFRGAAYFDIDTQITKDFKIKERAKFGLGAQFYNILNHPNFANASGTVTSGSLGLISGLVGPPTSPYGSFQGASVSGRVMLVAAKFSF